MDILQAYVVFCFTICPLFFFHFYRPSYSIDSVMDLKGVSMKTTGFSFLSPLLYYYYYYFIVIISG